MQHDCVAPVRRPVGARVVLGVIEEPEVPHSRKRTHGHNVRDFSQVELREECERSALVPRPHQSWWQVGDPADARRAQRQRVGRGGRDADGGAHVRSDLVDDVADPVRGEQPPPDVADHRTMSREPPRAFRLGNLGGPFGAAPTKDGGNDDERNPDRG